jgi:hypothetical protein
VTGPDLNGYTCTGVCADAAVPSAHAATKESPRVVLTMVPSEFDVVCTSLGLATALPGAAGKRQGPGV